MKNFFVGLFVAISLVVSAQRVHFQSGTYILPINKEDLSRPLADEMAAGTFYRVVVAERIWSDSEKAQWTNAGWILEGYLPDRAYLLRGTPGKVRVPAGGNFLTWSRLEAEMKLSNVLSSGQVPDHAQAKDRWEVLFLMANTGAAQQFEKILAASDAATPVRLESDDANVVRATVVPQALRALAAYPGVQFVQQKEAPAEPENNVGRKNHRTNAVQAPYSGGRAYDGTGIVVGLGDDGDIGPHVDYTGRILANYSNASQGNHGDHVGGTILGGGNKDPRGRGNAPGADLVYYSYPGNLSQVDNHYALHTVRITNSSYSDGCNTGYTMNTRNMDQDIRQNKQLMHVFSAGNNGTANCNYGAGAGWGNITGGHKQGKNVIAVANLDGNDAIAGSSSRGPARDGRIKPDVAALGTNVFSTIENHSYASYTGTSMACPGTAGTLATLYHAYRSTHANAYPDGGLMKAIMMNSADDLGNAGPDFLFGYGRINALRAVRTIEQNRFAVDSVAAGQTDTLNFTVPANTKELRVMVYWTDPEALANAGRAIVNNLNMRVVRDGQFWLPWVLNPNPVVASLSAPAVRAVDSLNNVEQVTLADPSAGPYKLLVNGFAVPQGPQKYYVVYEFVSDNVELTYPVGGEAVVPGSTESVRWDASAGTTSFTLETSTNGGTTWTFAATAAANARAVNWSVPTTPTGNLLLRIVRGSQIDQVDAPLKAIGIPSGLAVAWMCPDSTRLTWNAVAGASAYTVYRLGSRDMDSLRTVSGTGTTLVMPANQNTWFAVAAVTSNGRPGERCIAIEKGTTLTGCIVQKDASVVAISSPAQGQYPSCQPTGSMAVRFVWKNSGLDTLYQVPFAYRLNNATPTLQTFNGVYPPGFQSTFTFGVPANSSAVGTYTLSIYAQLSGDQNRYNDTVKNVFSVVSSGTPAVLPYVQNFDSFTNCATTNNCATTVCALGGGLTNAPNGSVDNIDWRTHNGTTPTNNTGPNGDHTSGTGKYVYMESTNCFNQEAHLLLPCVNLANSTLPELSVWVNMNGASIGTFSIDVLADNAWNLNVVPPKSGPQGAGWIQIKASLAAYVGKVIQVRLRGTTGATGFSDMALDDISIQEITSAPTASFFAQPSNACPGQTIVLTDNSTNGSTSRKWRIQPAGAVFVNGTDSTSAVANVQLPAVGVYSVTLWASNPFGSDTVAVANALTISNGTALPIVQTFNNAWLPAGWQIGNPDNGTTWDRVQVVNRNGAASQAPRLDNFNYNSPLAEDYLVTPVFSAQGAAGQMYFDVAYAPYSASYPDGLRIDISTDCGQTWQPSGYSKTWSQLATTAATTSAFTPNSAAQWRVDTVNFPSGLSSVAFRFASINGYGNNLYLDNVNIETTTQVAPVASIAPLSGPFCIASPKIFTAQNPVASSTYQWNFGPNAAPSSATGPGPHSIVYVMPGAQTVTLQVSNPVGTDTDTAQFTVANPMVLAYSFQSNFGQQTVDLVDLTTPAPTARLWTFWDLTTSTLPALTKPFPATGGTYTVHFQVSDACATLDTSFTVYVSGLGTPEDNWGAWLAPNPTSGKALWHSNGATLLHWTALDGLGRAVRTSNASSDPKTIDLIDLPAGVYTILAQTDRGTAPIRLHVVPE